MRLIDVNAFLAREIKRCHCIPIIGSCERDYEPLTCILDQEPPIDAVQVVRCKDCEYFGTNDENVPYCFNRFGLNDPEPNGFCNYGRKKNVD